MMVMARNNPSNRHKARPARRAFTLVEAVLASTILAIVAASASLPFVAVAQQTNAASEIETAVELGEELMEEILARPFYAPGEKAPSLGPEAGETERKFFNAVDDFENYTEFRGAGVTKHLVDFRGIDVVDDDFDGFWRLARVQYVRMADQEADDNDSFVRITVVVYRGNRMIVNLVRLRAREY